MKTHPNVVGGATLCYHFGGNTDQYREHVDCIHKNTTGARGFNVPKGFSLQLPLARSYQELECWWWVGLNPSGWSSTTLVGAQAGKGHWLTRQKRGTEVSALSCLGLEVPER